MSRSVQARKQTLAAIREQMARQNIDAYIITMFDDHHSEYVADSWRIIEWVSGFTGSAGTLVLTLQEAALWTDGRYFIQAAAEITDTGIVMVKDRIPGQPKIHEWILARVGSRGMVAADGRCVSIQFADQLAEHCTQINWHVDLISDVWSNRPDGMKAPVYTHDIAFTGKSRMEKITAFRTELQTIADASLLASLDDIAWLLNLRGSDVPYNPIFYAFLFIGQQDTILFIDRDKLKDDVRLALIADNIEIKDYDEVYPFISAIDVNIISKLHLDPGYTSIKLRQMLPDQVRPLLRPAPSIKMKAVKGDAEISHMRQTAVTEGLALTRLSRWIKEIKRPGQISEYDVSRKMTEIRKQGQHYVDDSFPTIAAFNENAAQMHYIPGPAKSVSILENGVLLVDTGGHYLGGTTDVTRTYLIGEPDQQIKEDFTLVLKSNIALSRAVFLKGTSGQNLDILARLPMWQQGLDYKCGTGHGVGYLLSVHEGPQSFSINGKPVALEPGMIITNEPGIYKEGQWGIRLENMLLDIPSMDNDNGTFYQFEPISYCPIDLAGVLTEQLTVEEKQWLNHYHERVYQELSPYLATDEKDWLRQATRSI